MIGLLLDTHAFLWYANGNSKRMPESVLNLISDPSQTVYVSAASIWEIATKMRIGKLFGAEEIVRDPRRILSELDMIELPIDADHATLAGGYQVPHRDPFDRMLAAQCDTLGLGLVSVDAALDLFGILRIWDMGSGLWPEP